MVALEQLIIPLSSLILFIFFLHKWCSSPVLSPRKNPPPSPKALPIIGNLHQLGASPHRSLQLLSKRYGQLFLLRFGRVPVLVVSSAEAAREIMKNQDAIFSNRPKSGAWGRVTYGFRDVAFAPYGEYWRQVRSICVLQLLSNKRVQSFRCVREEETSAMIEKIKRMQSSSPAVNLNDALVSLTNNVVCKAALGSKYGDNGNDHKKFKELLKEFGEVLGATNLGDYIPWLGWINRINGLDAKAERVAKRFDEFLEMVIREHKDRGRNDDGDGGFDFVDILLEFQRESKSGSPVGDDTIKALILDMFAAGTDTTVTALEWAMAELIKNPRTMKILQNEVRRVARTKKEIEEDDIEKMPYLKAVIKETLRLHPPVPLLVPHESMQDTKVMGYDVLAGTRVLINAWAISRDPTLWENPEEFRPERFMGPSVDFRGLHFELIPFGAGRRGCPGISFAVAVNELGLAKLVNCFNFALPGGEREEDLDMSEAGGLTVHKRLPLLVISTSNTC